MRRNLPLIGLMRLFTPRKIREPFVLQGDRNHSTLQLRVFEIRGQFSQLLCAAQIEPSRIVLFCHIEFPSWAKRRGPEGVPG